MSYARMVEAEPKLAAEVAGWLEPAGVRRTVSRIAGMAPRTRRRDAGLGGEHGTALGEEPRSQGCARSRGAGGGRGQAE